MFSLHHQAPLSNSCTSSCGLPNQRFWRLPRLRHGLGVPPAPIVDGFAQRHHVTCMAHPRRVARVAKQIEREIGSLMLIDPVLQLAVCPEKKAGTENALSAIASVTEVELSNDLQVAKVYVSIYSDEQGRDQAMLGLTRLQGYVRKHVASTVRLRLCPEIRFIRDDSIERGEQVLALLERIKQQAAGTVEPPPITLPSKYELQDDEEEDDGDEDDAEDEKDSVAGRRRRQGSQSPESTRRTVTAGKIEGGVDEDDRDDEDGFLDLDAEDEDGDEEEEDVVGLAQEASLPVRRVLAPLSTEGGFFGFEEPGRFAQEPSLTLSDLRAGSSTPEGGGQSNGRGKGKGKAKGKR